MLLSTNSEKHELFYYKWTQINMNYVTFYKRNETWIILLSIDREPWFL